MPDASPQTSPTLPDFYNEEQTLSKTERLTPKPIENNPADCDHFFEIIERGSRELLCTKCPYGAAFRLGCDLDELRDGKPYLRGKPALFRKPNIS